MIKLYKNHLNFLVHITSFKNSDYVIMKSIINDLIEYSKSFKKNITIYVDTFNLCDYSILYVYKLIKFNSRFTYSEVSYISNIELYINSKNKSLVSKFTYILKALCPINININYVEKEKKWHKIFKEI